MPESKTACYEGMFLLSQASGADLAGAVEHIDHLMQRASAEVLAMQKWDERRLAYEIDKQRRGIYILTYFRAPRDAVASLENDVNISDVVMRAMFLRADHLTEDEMRAHDQRQSLESEAKLRAEKQAEKQAGPAAGVVVKTAAQRAAEQQAAEEKPEPPTAAPEPDAGEASEAAGPDEAPAEASASTETER